MIRKARSILGLVATSLLATQFSCTATLGTALRDAAIDGAASFVERTTTDLLDQWLGSATQE